MNKVKIDQDKLSRTFKIRYKESYEYVFEEDKKKIKTYVFKLGDDNKYKAASLWFHEDKLNEVNLTIIAKSEYRSTINFLNITKIIYIPKYRAIRFESHTKTHFSVLKVYWRGQFDLFSNWPEKNYNKTGWAQRRDY